MKKNIILPLLTLLLYTPSINAQDADIEKTIAEQFNNPPVEARPQVWWHWMDGNITKEGIRKDLLWMKRVGIGGAHVFDAGMTTPQIVEKRLSYMSDEWKDALAYAVQLADSLGLEITIPSSPGWSLMGGPWVEPEDAMKKLTWREMIVEGNGKQQVITLPNPFTTTGPFQNKPLETNLLLGEVIPDNMPSLYKDTKVLAFRLNDDDKSLNDFETKITCNDATLDLAALTDGDLSTSVKLPVNPATGKAVVDIYLKEKASFRSLSLSDGRIRPEFDALKADTPCCFLVEDEQGGWQEVVRIPSGGAPIQTVDIPETYGSHFRLEIDKPAPDYTAIMMGLPDTSTTIELAELNLFTNSKINHAEEKVGFMSTADLEDSPTPTTSETFPKITEIVDLTDLVKSDGSLTWKVPEGKWRVLRFGYSLTGKRNHPASTEATGLEIDKLDKDAWRRYFTHYLDMYKDAANGMLGDKGIEYLLTDSYESGASTWTGRMTEEFNSRRGYDQTPWMPVLAGYIVESAVASERFLWDWRKTISELIAENYDLLSDILNDFGMKGRYTESHEHGRLYMVDGMDVKRKAAIPMGAIWISDPNNPMSAADLRESASVAHLYGQNIVAAESFTVVGYPNNGWRMSPEDLKPYADFAFANGVNRIVVHTSPHQPSDNHVPGLSLSAVGQWFDRHETWAEQASAWVDYLSRSSYMLQQGRHVADIAYYYGEDNNISALFGHQSPAIPYGYDFDYVNADALINLLEANDYKILLLDKNAKRMSMPVLKKIARLADAGMIICGIKPEMPASLSDDEEEFHSIVSNIWESGRNNIYVNLSLAEVLAAANIEPDIMLSEKLNYVHRATNDCDIYWISNPTTEDIHANISFRVADKCSTTIFNPYNGDILPIDHTTKDGRTLVEIDMTPHDALFIVLSKHVGAFKWAGTRPAPTAYTRKTFNSQPSTFNCTDWTLILQGGIKIDSLKSLTEFSDPEIKYFSGTATYTSKFTLTETGKCVTLDLGEVKNIAEIFINGKKISTLWKHPFLADITDAVKLGKNELEIRVTNLWANRLIGEARNETKDKVAFTSFPYYTGDAPLIPSGLIGPVKLITEQ